MREVKELIEEAESILEELKDFNLLRHLWSENQDIKNLAKLRQSIGQLLFKLKLQKIRELDFNGCEPFQSRNVGRLVRVRPCDERFNGKTYLGVYLGDCALSMKASISAKKLKLETSYGNPAILIPEMKEIVYGCGSWWSEIKSAEDLKDITNESINNIWYVQLLKDLDISNIKTGDVKDN